MSPQGQAWGQATSSFCLRHSGPYSTILSWYHGLGDLDLKHCVPLNSWLTRVFLSLLATSFSLPGGDNPGQTFSLGNSHTMGLALDLFLEIKSRNNNLRDGRRKFKTKTAVALTFIWSDLVAKHCPPLRTFHQPCPPPRANPSSLLNCIMQGGLSFLQAAGSFAKPGPSPRRARCQNLTASTPSNAAGEQVTPNRQGRKFIATCPPTKKKRVNHKNEQKQSH